MNNSLNLSDCIEDVCDATGLPPPVAKALLERNNWQANPEMAIEKSISDVKTLDSEKKQQLKRIACDAGQAGIGNFLGSLLDNYLRDRSIKSQQQHYPPYSDPYRPYDRYNTQPYGRYNAQPYDRYNAQPYSRPNYQPEYRPTPQLRSYQGPPPIDESDLEKRYRELEEKYRQLEERLNQSTS